MGWRATRRLNTPLLDISICMNHVFQKMWIETGQSLVRLACSMQRLPSGKIVARGRRVGVRSWVIEVSSGSPVDQTSVVAGDRQNLRFSAVLDESPGNLENPATASFEALKRKNRFEQSPKRFRRFSRNLLHALQVVFKSAWGECRSNEGKCQEMFHKNPWWKCWTSALFVRCRLPCQAMPRYSMILRPGRDLST